MRGTPLIARPPGWIFFGANGAIHTSPARERWVLQRPSARSEGASHALRMKRSFRAPFPERPNPALMRWATMRRAVGARSIRVH